MHRVLWLCPLVVCASAGAAYSDETLSPDEQAALAEMDSPTIASVLQLAGKCAEWQRKLDAIRRSAQGVAQSPDEVSALALAKEVAAALDACPPSIQQRFKGLDELKRLIQEADDAYQSAKYDAQDALGQAEDEFRDDVNDFIGDAYEPLILKQLDANFFSAIQGLKNPAQFARDFLEQTIKKDFLNKPYNIDPDISFMFQQDSVDQNISLFSDKANIAIVVQYQEGIQLKARGLYFQYQRSGLPRPVFDKMQPDASSLGALAANTALKFLGDLFPVDFGLGITVTSANFNGFAPGPKRGSITLGVTVGNLLDFAPDLVLQAKDVTIYANGKVECGSLKGEIPLEVPVGDTSLVFSSGSIELRPKDKGKQVTLGTHLVDAVGAEDGLWLDITVTFGFPVSEVSITGTLRCSDTGLAIGTVVGTISRSSVQFTLTVPPPDGGIIPPQVFQVTAHGVLDQQGFSAGAVASLFSIAKVSSDIVFRFDGSGHVMAKNNLQIAGVDATSTFMLQFSEHFKSFEMEANFTVDVDLKVFQAEASVDIQASSKSSGIQVTASACNVATATFEVGGLNELGPDRIAQELLKNLPNILLSISDAAARFDKNSSRLLAEWSQHWSDELHNEAQKLGVASFDTHNALANQYLGQIAKDGKAVGGMVSDAAKKDGKVVSDAIKNPAQALASLPGNAVQVAHQAGGQLLGALSTIHGDQKHDNGPSPDDLRRQRLTQAFQDKTKDLLDALEKVQVSRRPPPQVSTVAKNVHKETRELRFTFKHAAAATEGDGGGVIGLVVLAAASFAQVDSHDPPQRRYGSKVLAATITFQGLVADGKQPPTPTAKVDVDPWDNPSGFDASGMIRDEIERLLQFYLPNLGIDGVKEYSVRALQLHNMTDETVTAWVQGYVRPTARDILPWQWIPGVPARGEALRFVIPAKKDQLVILPQKPAGGAARAATFLAGVAQAIAALRLPMEASRVRVWAEDDAGDRWPQYKDKDLWLVAPNPKFDNQRVYHAEEMDTFHYRFRASPGPKLFSEKLLTLQNDTRERLVVDLRYYSSVDGKAEWRKLDKLVVGPGVRTIPRTSDGLRVRASQICFTAQGSVLFFGAHASQPLFTVPESANKQRVYRAEKMEEFVEEFRFTAETAKTGQSGGQGTRK